MKASARILKAAFEKKRAENGRISIQFIANKLGLSRSLISQILSGKRNLPARKLDAICALLDLDKEKRDILVKNILGQKNLKMALGLYDQGFKPNHVSEKSSWKFLPKKQFSVLQEWFYLAVLESTMLEDYDGTTKFLADRLGISQNLAESTLLHLANLGLIEEKDGKRIKGEKLYDVFSGAEKKEIRAYHLASLRKSMEAITSQLSPQEVDRRLITGMTVTVAEDRIEWVQQKISDLLLEVGEEAARTSADEVYQLAVQFVPLTNKKQ